VKNFIAALFISSLFVAATVQAKPIAENADMVTPLLNGQYVPDVKTTTLSGKQLPLKQVLNGHKTVMFFYRGGWCPYCNTQMGQLKQLEPKLKAMGFQLVGVSTDAPDGLQSSIEKLDLGYTLLSDFDSSVSQAFGLAFFASKKTTDRYVSALKLENPLKKNSAGESRLVLPAPAVYIFDSKGLVQFNYVNSNFKVRLHQDVLMAAAKLVK